MMRFRVFFVAGLSCLAALALMLGPAPTASSQTVEPVCTAYVAEALPQGFAGCDALQKRVENTASFMGEHGFKLAEYERVVAEFFGKYCHRNAPAGWVHDKRLRDTGPYAAFLEGGTWQSPSYFGTHQPTVIWYSPSMIEWLRRYRPPGGDGSAEPPPIPDGAIMVKEMYEDPAARCDRVPPEHLKPPADIGVAFMIRDNENAHDGWFWGAWWETFEPDWPAGDGNGLTAMGFGPYCVNCHGSARDNLTFADLKNVAGEPGTPNVYLSQNFLFETEVAGHRREARHRSAIDTSDDPPREQEPLGKYNPAFLAAFPTPDPPATAQDMPSQTYDHVWVPGGPVGVANQFLTSDQCIGCHDAGSTGLQYDMTEPAPRLGLLLNYSPYGTWRTSPMGLGGRDPIFFAQLASETETFHPTRSRLIQDVCLGCHGIQGQRQFGIDRVEAGEDCGRFERSQLDAIPYPADVAQNPTLPSAPYGALGRDGIACTACHRMALTSEEIRTVKDQPQNHCVEERQALLNPDNRGFAKTFTGSFFVGPPAEFLGPFTDPKPKPMDHALGMQPVASQAVKSSELCGTCHTVHLPIYGGEGKELGFSYEQTTYPEWAFSAYRTGTTADGTELPGGAGSLAQSCQGCHMKSASPAGGRFQSKIASIQELSNFPASENTLPGEDIDLAVRDGFARHTLVGLNTFLVEMAQQFPDVLGIPTQDPMMVDLGLDPLLLTEQALLAQASTETADVAISGVRSDGGKLRARVTVTSHVGHKFPSGVGFRRAFVELEVLDAAGGVLWASGRTNGAGVIVDENGQPLTGEYWWTSDCSARLPGTPHQPHYQIISRQDQAQIYQELVTTPAPVPNPRCGRGRATPGGQLTTSFLSICGAVKDNRLLPDGYLGEAERVRIAKALGAGADLAEDSGPWEVGDDPDYRRGGADSLAYEIDTRGLAGAPAYLRATLYSQSTPPSFLQDRFCTSQSTDTQRLYYLAGHLDLAKSRQQDWKLEVVSSGLVEVAR
jgi:hypothetical protein